MIPYLPDGVYADLRTASNIRFQLQAELTRIQNRMVFRLKRRKSALIGLESNHRHSRWFDFRPRRALFLRLS